MIVIIELLPFTGSSAADTLVDGHLAQVVYNHWIGTVDWNGGMEWWNHKFSKNEVKRSQYCAIVVPDIEE